MSDLIVTDATAAAVPLPGRDLLTFIAPDGVEHHLSDRVNTKTLLGLAGTLMPPFQFVTSETFHGTHLRGVKAQPRDIDIPLFVTDSGALANRLATLVDALNPERGDGTLRYTRTDGTRRILTPVRYVAGAGGVYSLETRGSEWAKMVLTLRSFESYWQDDTPQESTYAVSVSATFFPFFPLRVSGSEVFTEQPIQNDGHALAWPVWTITGPGSDIALRNLTTGEVLTISRTLAAGETLTIDTRPGKKTIRLGDGSNLFTALSPTSELWALRRGTNTVRVEMGSVSAASLVALSFRRRWLTP